jgi:K+-sensing histidine kinase KdpD
MKSDREDLFHKRKSSFISKELTCFSHSVQDPLSTIRESAVLLGDLLGDAEQWSGEELEQFTKILSTIEDQVNMLSQKSTYLDRFTQRMNKSFIKFNPKEIVEEVVSFSGRFARTRQTSLELDVAEALPDVQSDPLRIYLVVSIMIDGMLEQVVKGGKVLVLVARADDEVLIEVQGHGVSDTPRQPKEMDRYMPSGQKAINDLGGRIETSTTGRDIKRESLFLPIKQTS